MNCWVLSDGVGATEPSCIVKPVVVWPGWMAWALSRPGQVQRLAYRSCSGVG